MQSESHVKAWLWAWDLTLYKSKIPQSAHMSLELLFFFANRTPTENTLTENTLNITEYFPRIGSVGSFQVFRGLLAYGEKLRKALLDEPGLEPLRCSLFWWCNKWEGSSKAKSVIEDYSKTSSIVVSCKILPSMAHIKGSSLIPICPRSGLTPGRLSLRVLLRIAKHLQQRPDDVHGALSLVLAVPTRIMPLIHKMC